MTKPDAIYIDTNILLRYSPTFEGSELRKLVSLCKTVNVRLFTTEIVFRELLNLTKANLDKICEGLSRNIDSLRKFDIQVPSAKDDIIKLQDYNLESFLSEKLESLNITILPTAEVPLQRMVHMAINDKAPFESHDKGFKDTLIMFGILNHARKSNFNSACLLTSDRIFLDKNIEKIASEYNIYLQVITETSEAIEILKQTLKKEFREYLAKKEREMKDFLSTQLPVIKDYLIKTAYAENFFKQSSAFPLNAFLKEIRDIDVVGIKKVVYVDEKEIDNRKQIETSFIVDTVFQLLVRIVPLRRLYAPFFYVESSGWDATKSQDSEERIEQRQMKLGANMSALVDFKEPNNYSNLQIKEQFAYFI